MRGGRTMNDNELVIMHDQQAVTTSLQVANNFEKLHKNVLRDIDALKRDVLNFEQMFIESMEQDSYGRDRRIYYMNRDGFSLLAMGFTGKQALQFKLKYIDAFNKMEKQLQQQKPLTLPEQIQIIAKGYESLSEDVKDIKERMGLPGNMAHAFTKKRNAKIITVLGGKDANAYCDKNIRSKTYRALFSSYRETFDQDRYNDLPMKDYDKAVGFINNWYPPFELQQEIQRVNAQLAIM